MNQIQHFSHDHCQMPASRNPRNGQRLLNITDIPHDLGIDRVSLEDSRLVIEFTPDGHRSEFDLDWLYENCYCLNRQYDDRSEINKILWSGDSFEQGLPHYAYDAFCAQPRSRCAALQAVRDYGFVLLDAVPCEEGQVLKVIEQFGYVRETNYGPLFEVRTRVDPNNLAFTNLGLGCHLDNPYRDPVPGLQLLHCLESSTAGGESILQDGFMAAKILRDENPEHFALLSQNWINFRFRDLPPAVIRSFYAAYRHYAEILEREALQIVFKLQPGELMLFDNTRILHARRAYSAEGSRHLQGAYSDLDGLYSSLRALEVDS
jgi:gamma-butyrobetaine dioxygenase